MTNTLPTTTQQPELNLTTPAPRVSDEEVRTLCAVLRCKGWLRAAEIADDLAHESNDPARRLHWSDRKIRAIAEASDGAVVSYPGSPGYKLFDEASEAEIAHAIQAMCSQGKRMIERSLALDKRHHQRRLVDRPQASE